ncbi:MAG: cytochrome c3 family protein [Bacteroidota bacterium]
MKYSKNIFRILFFFISIIITVSVCLAREDHITAEQANEECLACHSDNSLSITRRGKVISLYVDSTAYNRSVHGSLQCTSCHEGFDPNAIPHKAKIAPPNCRQCHDVPGFAKSVHGMALSRQGRHGVLMAPRCWTCHTKHAVQPASTVAKDSRICLTCHQRDGHVAAYLTSIHAKRGKLGAVNASCVDCHHGHDIPPLKDPDSPVNRQNIGATCGRCHVNALTNYERSDHARAVRAGIIFAPTCVDCHGDHGITSVSSQQSPVNRENQVTRCLHCHLDNPDVRNRVGVSAGFVQGYEHSIHGMLHQQGKLNAAVCSDCHRAHEILRGGDPRSSVYKVNIPQTCSKCHEQIARTYEESVHGKAIASGILSAPVCTNCHGEHNILPPTNPASPVAPQHVSAEVCSPCHSSVRMAERYNIPLERTKTYYASYHGLAVRGGSTEAANCASCHGVHDIKPSSDPTSSINKSNLAKTCGKCHPGVTEKFASTPIHLVTEQKEEPIVYYVTAAYIVLIVVVIGGMFIHNLLDFFKRANRKLSARKHPGFEKTYSQELYLRMNVNERVQHGLVVLSFTTLVVTGFMLHFPDAFWVRWIRDIGGVGVFEIRSLLHRIAGATLLIVGVYHIVYIVFTERGRKLIIDLLPRLKDVQDAIGVMKYNLGLSDERPKFDRFSYVEKSEYWALVWGTVIMGSTGIVMWFENTFASLFTKLIYDVSRVIHYYEAWLATLAILVWHMYAVIFNPDIYPLNTSCITGTLSEEEMESEHPLELERIKAERRAEEEIEVLEQK